LLIKHNNNGRPPSWDASLCGKTASQRNLNLCSKSLRRLVGASIWGRQKIAGKVWRLDEALIPAALSA